MIINYDGLAEVGINRDLPEYDLPPNAFTSGNNVRFSDGSVQKMRGYETVFGATSGQPLYLLPLRKQNSYYWFYPSQTKIYLTDGTTHADASSGTYGATIDLGWNGGVLGGGVAILNNGVDKPQSWTGTSVSTAVTDLANWPSGMVARVVRPFKQHLIAMDINEGSGRIIDLLRWSHPADPGSVPSSWDYTSATVDAGRTTIGDEAGASTAIIDGGPLRDVFIIYKENSVYAMQYTGGINVFAFRKLFDQFGALSRNCFAPFKGSHIVLSTDDVIIHDGQNFEQVLNRRWRRHLFNSISGTNYQRCFVACNYNRSEAIIAYPESGNDYCNHAVIWNWKDNTVYERDIPNLRHAAWGVADSTSSQLIDSATLTIDTYVQLIDNQAYSGANRDLIMADAADNRLLLDDKTELHNGATFRAFVERKAIPFGRDEDGQFRVDLDNMKFVKRIWPRITGTDGGTVHFYVGGRNQIGDAEKWEGPFTFVLGTDRKIDCRVSGRLIDIRVESMGNISWSLNSLGIEYERGGVR